MNSSEWKSLLEDEPDNELLRFSYAKALMDERDFARAAGVFGELVDEKPDYVIAWAFLARSLLESGDRDGARRAAEAGMPLALKFNHEVPIEELEAVLEELSSEF
ncbi:MAG: tetratricopeptide repeat protein [Bdellovibrionota bacterium]